MNRLDYLHMTVILSLQTTRAMSCSSVLRIVPSPIMPPVGGGSSRRVSREGARTTLVLIAPPPTVLGPLRQSPSTTTGERSKSRSVELVLHMYELT